MNGVRRIMQAYEKRELAGKKKLYSPFNPAALYLDQHREREILSTLGGLLGPETPLTGKIMLDLGCGDGGILREFVKYGAEPGNCYGIDLIPERIETARKLSPNMNFTCGNAERLPFIDETFDVVILFTVFSSILESSMKRNISSEVLRVLRWNGFALYYDFLVSDYRNSDVKGVMKRELRELFPECDLQLKRSTLAPPICRKLVPVSSIFCQILEKMPLLCTHYLGTIRKV